MILMLISILIGVGIALMFSGYILSGFIISLLFGFIAYHELSKLKSRQLEEGNNDM